MRFLTVRGIQPASEVGKFCNVMILNFFGTAFLTLAAEALMLTLLTSFSVVFLSFSFAMYNVSINLRMRLNRETAVHAT